MFCGKCGCDIAEGDNFCPKCGERVKSPNKVIVRGDFILSSDEKEILYYQGTKSTVTIPKSVRKIGEYAFSGNKYIHEIAFEKGEPILAIGEGSFFDCQNLKNVELPDNITKIERYAFLNCVKLERLGTEARPTEIGANVFDGTQVLYTQLWKSFERGEDMITIDQSGHWLVGYMQRYPGIIDVDKLTTVNTIATGAFSYCRNLDKIVFNGQSTPAKKYNKDMSVPPFGNR